MKKELIKDIIGFEGLYKISSLGKIWRYKSKKRLVNGEFLELPERELKIGGKVGYPAVSLLKNGKLYGKSMHRLMAIHFIENDKPLIKNEVNHKNKNILDFSLENLEWCTRSENMKHAKKKINNTVFRKIIKIKPEDVIPLKILAVKAGKNLKEYIKDLISDHVDNKTDK